MAKEKKFDNLDAVMNSANLTEKKKPSLRKDKKIKTIQILTDWEDRIKGFHGGTIASYITVAIQEKMRRDGIL